MKAPKAPTPPSPQETAGAQVASNFGTAIANQSLQNVNQITPYGNLTYSQTGATNWTDPNTGKTYAIPQMTATQTLSPEQQQLFDLNSQTERNMAQIGVDQSSRIGSLLGTPFSLSNEATEARLMDLARNRVDPMLQRRRESESNRLVQQGIMPGSEAYDRAMTRLDQGENDAYNELALRGRGQAVQEALSERNQPINEIAALMSGSQVSQPNFMATQGTTVPNVDVAGLTMDNYNARLNNWQTQVGKRQNLMGGLLGMGGNFGAALIASDRRAKRNVKMIDSYGRLPVYSFQYLNSDDPRVGFMAQDVERIAPDAVHVVDGLKCVDYVKAMEAANA